MVCDHNKLDRFSTLQYQTFHPSMSFTRGRIEQTKDLEFYKDPNIHMYILLGSRLIFRHVTNGETKSILLIHTKT